jgi:hypothetical protein
MCGLDWAEVRPLISEALGDLDGVHVMVYPPGGAPEAALMKVSTPRPAMTAGRAVLLALMGRYVRLSQLEEGTTADGASLLEIQKLAYFLQEAGQPLSLAFVKARYGPYADNLNHALQPLEGHFLRGYGDRTQEVLKLSPIVLLPGAQAKAEQWIAGHADGQATDRIDAVMSLAEGFASAYGLELLSTVHWAAIREAGGEHITPASVIRLIEQWNARKGRLFTEVHVRRALEHLERLHWLNLD